MKIAWTSMVSKKDAYWVMEGFWNSWSGLLKQKHILKNFYSLILN